jgi:tetratricopeptide (TPR) repeat protein
MDGVERGMANRAEPRMDGGELALFVRSGRVLPILEVYGRSSAIRHRRWLHDGLSRALDRADPGSVPAMALSALRELGLSPESLDAVAGAPPEHAVHIPLVAERPEESFCRLMRVIYDPPGSLSTEEALDPDARLAVVDALRAASERLGYRPDEHFTFGPVRVRGLDGMRIHGGSLAAGAFVSAFALWAGRPVQKGLAITGCILEGRLISAGGMDAKVRALEGRSDIARFIVPTADHPHALSLAKARGLTCEVIGVSTLDALLELCLSARPKVRPNIEAEVAEARAEWDNAWQFFRWPSVRERLSRLVCEVPSRRPDLLVRVQTMLAASYRQLGEPEAALELHAQALAVLATDEADRAVGDYERSFLYRHLALVYKDLCRFEDAEEAAVEAVAHARRGRRVLAASSGLGTAGLVALARGDAPRALGHLREALEETSSFDPNRAPRSHAYLVLAHGRAHQLDEARAEYRLALARLEDLGPSDRTRNDEQWLRTYMAEAAVLCGAPSEAREVLGAPCIEHALAHLPLPGLFARRWLGLAEVATGEVEAGLSRLASSPTVQRHSLAERVRFIAQLAVLYEGEARARRGLLDEDARGRALLALAQLPASRADGAFLGPVLDRTRELLEDRDADRDALTAALGALVDRCRALE